jgi:hypothetical protein
MDPKGAAERINPEGSGRNAAEGRITPLEQKRNSVMIYVIYLITGLLADIIGGLPGTGGCALMMLG